MLLVKKLQEDCFAGRGSHDEITDPPVTIEKAYDGSRTSAQDSEQMVGFRAVQLERLLPLVRGEMQGFHGLVWKIHLKFCSSGPLSVKGQGGAPRGQLGLPGPDHEFRLIGELRANIRQGNGLAQGRGKAAAGNPASGVP